MPSTKNRHLGSAMMVHHVANRLVRKMRPGSATVVQPQNTRALPQPSASAPPRRSTRAPNWFFKSVFKISVDLNTPPTNCTLRKNTGDSSVRRSHRLKWQAVSSTHSRFRTSRRTFYLARIVVALQRVRPQHPRVFAVEHSPGPLGAETAVSAVYPRHVLQREVARRKVEVRRVEGHEEGKKLVFRLDFFERKHVPYVRTLTSAMVGR